MENEKKLGLALKGVSCVLTVDPSSIALTDLYVTDPGLWKHLLDRFGGNHMDVTLRGPHDYKASLRMPPETVIEKLDTWITVDGTLDGIDKIVQEILDDDKR